MSITVGKPLSLKDIEFMPQNKAKSRTLMEIAIIDDEKFKDFEALRKNGFKATELGDISDIKSVSEYSIVVCDIKGVGKSFQTKFGAGYVISEIKQRYPDKYIIVYSGSTVDPTYKRFLDKCDTSVRKNADIVEWTNTLDFAIEQMANPIKRWIRLRTIFLDNSMELYDVFVLEQAYIKAFRKKNHKILEDAMNRNSLLDKEELLNESAKALITFTANVIGAGIVTYMTR
jgi:hypothetical protein